MLSESVNDTHPRVEFKKRFHRFIEASNVRMLSIVMRKRLVKG